VLRHDQAIQVSRNTGAVRGEAFSAVCQHRKRAIRKLQMLHAVERLESLRIPPQNRLEALKGDRKGQWSIRVNDQWRVCFVWKDGAAWDVEIVDYH
jgi:proteic killer suppression protein